MIDSLVRRFLGTAGSGVLDFYLQNSLWINLVLFIYAMLVVFARRNYFQVEDRLLTAFIQEHGDKLARKSRDEIRALLMKWNIPWGSGMQAGWFPFISTPQGFLLRMKCEETFQKIFPIDVLVETLVKQTSSRRK